MGSNYYPINEPKKKKRKYYLRRCRRCGDFYNATSRYSVVCDDCKKIIYRNCIKCKKMFRTSKKLNKRVCARCVSTLKKKSK